MRSFQDILYMVTSACKKELYHGVSGIESTVVESATKIYIAQMTKEEKDVEQK